MGEQVGTSIHEQVRVLTATCESLGAQCVSLKAHLRVAEEALREISALTVVDGERALYIAKAALSASSGEAKS